MPDGSKNFNSTVTKVCIVGGGPAAVAAAKHLLAEKHFTQIDMFEQRSRPGGVWDYEPENDALSTCPVPHTAPDMPLEQPIWRKRAERGKEAATYVSPLYERLEANLPKMLMQFSDLAFPDESQLFPTHDDILEYLERYADDVRYMIKFETQVTYVERVRFDPSIWSVTIKDLRSGRKQTREYDAVLVASGHYTVPFIPDYDGIQEWHRQHPRLISHSKHFTRPEDFANKVSYVLPNFQQPIQNRLKRVLTRPKKVLIVGNGPSGSDIATQIATYSAPPLLVSTRKPTSDPATLPTNSLNVPNIAAFLPQSPHSQPRSIRLADSTIHHSIDAIIFCTGYLYTYPFLRPPDPKACPLVMTGSRVHNIYQHIFHTPDPSLAFLTLPWNIVPNPVAESQGAAVARVWSGRLSLPGGREMLDWERRVEEEMGKEKGFHKLPPPKDIEYINELWRWCRKAEVREGVAGKEPPFWDERMSWLRKNVGRIKREFAGRGCERRNVKGLRELGFDVVREIEFG